MPVNPKRPLPGPRDVSPRAGIAQEDAAVAAAARPKSRDINVILMVGVALLVVGFLLPWVSVEIKDSQGPSRDSCLGVSMAFELRSYFGTMSGIYAAMKGEQAQEVATAYYLAKIAASWLYWAYAIPVLCGVAVADELMGARKGRNGWYCRAAAAVSPLLAFYGVAVGFGKIGAAFSLIVDASGAKSGPARGLFDVLDIGAYLCVAGMVVTLISVLTSPKPRAV